MKDNKISQSTVRVTSYKYNVRETDDKIRLVHPTKVIDRKNLSFKVRNLKCKVYLRIFRVLSIKSWVSSTRFSSNISI